MELKDILGLKSETLRDGWWTARGYDPLAPDAENTSYSSTGPTKEAAEESLRASLTKVREERRRNG